MSFDAESEPEHQQTSTDSNLATESYLPDLGVEECVTYVLDALSLETPNYNVLRTTDRHGRLPHHLLLFEADRCDSQDYMKAFKACYEHFPEGGYTQDKYGFVPLDYFVSGMPDRAGSGITLVRCGFEGDIYSCLVNELLGKEGLLLKAVKVAFQANPDAIFSSGLFEMVASNFGPRDAFWQLDNDMRELNEARQTKAIEALLDLTFVDATTTEARRNPLHTIATHSWMKYIEKALPIFLSIESAQAVDPTNQQLALHMAVSSHGVESQKRSTVDIGFVEPLVDIYPAALGRMDSRGRVPFVLACHNQCSVAVLFHLLRAKPDELAHFL